MGDERELEWIAKNEDEKINEELISDINGVSKEDDEQKEDPRLPQTRAELEKEWDEEPFLLPEEDDEIERDKEDEGREKKSTGNYFGVDDEDWRRRNMPL